MDRPDPYHLHDLQLLRTEDMVARYRTAPLQRGKGRLT